MAKRETTYQQKENFSQFIINTLSDLVAINSINPRFSEKGLGEAGVASYIERFFSGVGADITRLSVFDNRDNLICRFSGRDINRTLIFEAHMDTVSCDLNSSDEIAPIIKNGSLFGRGACDTKGSMAAMLCAIRSLIEEEDILPVNVIFIGTVDEEYQAAGIYELIKTGLHADGAIVGEPTGLDIIIAHKGCYRFSITTRGKAAHSSTPKNGINAIYGMMNMINGIRSKLEPKYEERKHELVGTPTINIGIISGGKEVNTVPDYCTIGIDRRVVPGEHRTDVENEFDELITELRDNDPDFSAVIENRFFDPPLSTQKTERIVSAAYSACRMVHSHVALKGAQYGSDASKLSSIGIPSIVLGPGEIKNAHSAIEYVNLDEVISATYIYREIIKNFT